MTKKQLQMKNHPFYFLVLGCLTIFIMYSKTIAESISQGISLAMLSIVPSIFIFLVFSDFLASNAEKIPHSKFISKLFSIPIGCEGALACGVICGFPCGVKYAVKLYEGGLLTKDELERVIGLVNNPSLAFVISAVGNGIFNSKKIGLMLFVSVLTSVIITAHLYKSTSKEIAICEHISEQTFSFSKSIKSAGLSSIIVSSYIIFFSAVLGILKKTFKSTIFAALLAAILEIGNTVSILKTPGFDSNISFIILGFALGFSGISVHLQTIDILPENVSLKKYYVIKITQGIICAIIASTLNLFIHS